MAKEGISCMTQEGISVIMSSLGLGRMPEGARAQCRDAAVTQLEGIALAIARLDDVIELSW